jgi:hypothetical protein
MDDNKGRAITMAATRRVDFATGRLYDLEVVPRVSSVTPRAGSRAGGTALTIGGNGFGTDPAEIEVTVDGVACVVTTAASDTLECRLGERAVPSGPEPAARVSAGGRGVRVEWHDRDANDPAWQWSSVDSIEELRGIATPVATPANNDECTARGGSHYNHCPETNVTSAGTRLDPTHHHRAQHASTPSRPTPTRRI